MGCVGLSVFLLMFACGLRFVMFIIADLHLCYFDAFGIVMLVRLVFLFWYFTCLAW